MRNYQENFQRLFLLRVHEFQKRNGTNEYADWRAELHQMPAAQLIQSFPDQKILFFSEDFMKNSLYVNCVNLINYALIYSKYGYHRENSYHWQNMLTMIEHEQ
jgi:hypothetical protein